MSKIRVVIADDNELMLDMTSTILKNDDDIEVVAELTDGLSILSVIEEKEPDIILLDMVMPLVDGLGVGDVGNIVLRDRQHLSQDGLIIVVLTMDGLGNVVAGPDIISRGFVYVRESENLMDEVKRTVQRELYKCEEKGIKDWSSIKSSLKDGLRDYVFAKTKRNPMILPIIMEV